MKLIDCNIHHAGRRKIMHPELGKNIYSQTAVCYLRFPGKVRVDHLELPIENTRFTSGRWVPLVPTHPAHIIVSTLDGNGNRWKTIKEIELPRNPKFAGEGLSQEMSMEETEEFFSRAVAEKPSHIIELGGTETICLKVECDREYPGWPNHGECNGGPFNVPFGIFARLSAFGEELENDDLPPYHKKLEKTVFAPSAPEGMKINERNPLEIVFEGKKLSVGFSLIRPMLTHLAWDCSGKGNTSQNRLLFTAYGGYGGCGGNGPHYITANKNFDAQNMTGKVSVEGNQVRYHDIETGCGITLNATFTVNAESITLELEQNAARDIPVIEGEAWRLLWNMRAGLTSVSGIPTVKEGRNGFVDLPALIVGDEGGCLSCRLLEGNGAFHTESYREIEMRSIGFIMSAPDTVNTSMLIPKGVSRTVFELKPSNLVPVQQGKEAELSGGLKNSWAAGFSAFRPEHGGFSNNAISANCHVNQWVAFDFAAFTAKADNGLDLKELVKFSIGRALMDGGGYGYHRSLYLDSDPMLLSGAGRIFQLTEDKEWLEYVRPGIAAAASRIIDNFDDKEGMIVCRALSGNSSSYRWSTNSMDVIGFGHIDAYVNAWSFRAMKNAAVVLKALGDDSLAANCREVAAALSENYAKQLVNPETGWVSGWKSRDGKLHDFGFLWVNAVACAFDVMGQAETAHAIGKLEAKRQELFPESGYLGLPLNLIPIKETDHMRVQINNHYRFVPSYENYTDGALSPVGVVYYIRALSSHGFKKEAGKIAESIEQGFEDGKFHGPSGTGKEFMTWTGADSGYEGTFGPNSGPLYAVAVERGIIVPPSPEWWPAD